MSSATLLTVISAVFTAHLLQAVTSAPHLQEKRDVILMPGTTSLPGPSQPKCVELPVGHYCRTFNYHTTMFPNPRQIGDFALHTEEEHLNQALGEFAQFTPLLNTHCHEKLGTLLCFFYFPFCDPGQTEPKRQLTTPCKSMCDEVTDPHGSCAMYLASVGLQWPQQFNCSAGKRTIVDTPVYPILGDPLEHADKGFCADQEQAPWPVPSPGTTSLPDISDPQPKCVELPANHYCRTFNYHTTMFPNPRQINDFALHTEEDHLNQALGEFAQFTPLLDTHCHEKLGTLLCFFYFPYCDPEQAEPKRKLSTPCKSMCEEVTDPSGSCAMYLASQNLAWPQQFDCSAGSRTIVDTPVYPILGDPLEAPDKGFCVDDIQAPWPPAPAIIKEITTEALPAATTESPTTPPPVCDICQEGFEPAKGKLRAGFNGKVFVRNTNYNFAFKATLVATIEYQCRRGYQFTVEKQFDLRDPNGCLTAPTLEVGSEFIALGDYSTEEAENVYANGETYIVAGIHRAAPEACSSPLWEVTDGVISEWRTDKKYDSKMENWVNNGNDERNCS